MEGGYVYGLRTHDNRAGNAKEDNLYICVLYHNDAIILKYRDSSIISCTYIRVYSTLGKIGEGTSIGSPDTKGLPKAAKSLSSFFTPN